MAIVTTEQNLALKGHLSLLCGPPDKTSVENLSTNVESEAGSFGGLIEAFTAFCSAFEVGEGGEVFKIEEEEEE